MWRVCKPCVTAVAETHHALEDSYMNQAQVVEEDTDASSLLMMQGNDADACDDGSDDEGIDSVRNKSIAAWDQSVTM